MSNTRKRRANAELAAAASYAGLMTVILIVVAVLYSQFADGQELSARGAELAAVAGRFFASMIFVSAAATVGLAAVCLAAPAPGGDRQVPVRTHWP